MQKLVGWAVLLAVSGAGCGAGDDGVETASIAKTDTPKKCKEHKHKDKTHGDCSTTVSTVGVTGGTITTPNGLVLDIPFGALDTATTLTVITTDMAPPTGVGAVSPVYEFLPDGLVFATPIKVSLPLPTGVTAGAVYWSKLGAPGFDPIGGTIVGTKIVAETVHFSLAVIGSPSGTRTVIGAAQDTWITSDLETNNGRRTLPSVFIDGTIEAVVGDGMGGYVSLPGTYAANGTFTIPDVTVGQYILLAHGAPATGPGCTAAQPCLMIVTESNSPDLGRKLGGRPVSERTPITGTTILELTVNNLEPWDPADGLELWSTQVDDWYFGPDPNQQPTVGATSSVFSLDMQYAYNSDQPAEIHGPGDRVTVAQVTKQTSPSGKDFYAMARFADLPSTFSLSDGGTTAASVSLVSTLATETLDVDYRGLAHTQALAADGYPPKSTSCAKCTGFVGAFAQGGRAEDGFYTANADLLYLQDTGSTGTDFITGPMSYPAAAALGGQWGELYFANRTRQQSVVIPASLGPGGSILGNGMSWLTTRTALTAGPLVPHLTQVKNVTVNDGAAFAGGASVGLSPTVAWTPPSVGTPLYYVVIAREFKVLPNGRTGQFDVATVSTTETSFTFLAGQLDPARTYAFIVGAVASTSSDPNHGLGLIKAPFKSTNEIARANVSSGIFGNAIVIGQPSPVRESQANNTGMTKTATAIYWSAYTNPADGRIWSANLDGSNPHPVATGQAAPLYMAAFGSNVYWINQANGFDSTIQVYDGTSTTTLLTDTDLTHLAFAPNGDLVFATGDKVKVRRAAGGAIEILANEPARWVATDGTNVFFTQYGLPAPSATGRVLGVPLAGTGNLVTVMAENQPQAWHVETDGAYVYWSNRGQPPYAVTINRIPVGSPLAVPQVLASGPGGVAQSFTFTLDGGYVYFLWLSLKRVLVGGGPIEHVALNPCFAEGQYVAFGGNVGWTDSCGTTQLYRP